MTSEPPLRIRLWADVAMHLDAAQFGLELDAAPARASVEYVRADALAEMTRRRDEWRRKAEGFDAISRALREKVGDPWPPSLSRALWAGLAAAEKARADAAEAEVAALRAKLEGETL